MYTFREATDLTAFDQFVSDHHGQYQQCSLWPQVKTAWKPYFYEGVDERDERVLTCLVLERNLPLAGRLWYVPYGTVSNYEDEPLQRAFADFIRSEMKAHHAFVTIVDPPVPLRIDGEGHPEGHKVHKLLTALGYQLNTDLDSYTYKHPVQTMIPLRDEAGELIPAEKLLKKCEKGVRYSVRVGTSRGLVAEEYSWKDIQADPKILDEFVSVMDDKGDVHLADEHGVIRLYKDSIEVLWDGKSTRVKGTDVKNISYASKGTVCLVTEDENLRVKTKVPRAANIYVVGVRYMKGHKTI